MLAHYGSDKIRGHGIPEVIEAILLRGAHVEPKVDVLKPLSAAVSLRAVVNHSIGIRKASE
jgi:chloride channel protein, CIC family